MQDFCPKLLLSKLLNLRSKIVSIGRIGSKLLSPTSENGEMSIQAKIIQNRFQTIFRYWVFYWKDAENSFFVVFGNLCWGNDLIVLKSSWKVLWNCSDTPMSSIRILLMSGFVISVSSERAQEQAFLGGFSVRWIFQRDYWAVLGLQSLP